MDLQQYLQQAAINDDFDESGAFENLKSVNSAIDERETNPSVGFECNICLDPVQDPVVTFCGHLYCWPCIYRWINFQESSPEISDHQDPQCPVCKTKVSEKMLIPLYGRGQTEGSSSKDKLSRLIPQRPLSPSYPDSSHRSNQFQHLHHQSYALPSQAARTGNYMSSSMADPMIGVFGEMVYARIFGNSETTLYTYPNSYHLAGSNTPRLRRRMMQTDKSLSRVCFFFCCCMILCLLLF